VSRKRLGEVVKDAREGRGITQRSLARAVGVKASHIAYIENNRRRPSLTLLRRLADALELRRLELLLLAYPEAKRLVQLKVEARPIERAHDSWQRFASNRLLLRQHRVTRKELRLLKQVSLLEDVSSPRHFLFILNSIRQAATPDD
jgi:transcriptional regulator with XRE-family HTH domain